MICFSRLFGGDRTVSCRDCTKHQNESCDLIWEVKEANERLRKHKNRSLRLGETKEQYQKELDELRHAWGELRRKQFKCFNKRWYQYNKLGYDTFRIQKEQ